MFDSEECDFDVILAYERWKNRPEKDAHIHVWFTFL